MYTVGGPRHISTRIDVKKKHQPRVRDWLFVRCVLLGMLYTPGGCVRRSASVSLSVCFSLSFSLSVCISFSSLRMCECISAFVTLWLHFFLFKYFSLPRSLFFSLSPSLYFSLSIPLPVSLHLSLHLSVSWTLTRHVLLNIPVWSTCVSTKARVVFYASCFARCAGHMRYNGCESCAKPAMVMWTVWCDIWLPALNGAWIHT